MILLVLLEGGDYLMVFHSYSLKHTICTDYQYLCIIACICIIFEARHKEFQGEIKTLLFEQLVKDCLLTKKILKYI